VARWNTVAAFGSRGRNTECWAYLRPCLQSGRIEALHPNEALEVLSKATRLQNVAEMIEPGKEIMRVTFMRIGTIGRIGRIGTITIDILNERVMPIEIESVTVITIGTMRTIPTIGRIGTIGTITIHILYETVMPIEIVRR
jgi:hypothetical protein